MGTTTTNLALYKPTVGESGWASLVNANFDTLDLMRVSPVITGSGSWDSPTLVIDATNHRLGVGTASPASKLHIVGGNTAGVALAGGGIQTNWTVNSGAAIGGSYAPWRLATFIQGTDAAITDNVMGIHSAMIFGVGGVASVGLCHATTSNVQVQGCGDTNNEYTPLYAQLRSEIGTGFTQTTGPVGRYWLSDWKLHGPIGVQPNLLNGLSVLINNHYNGSPSGGASAGQWIMTMSGAGAATALHTAANTYPLDYGLGIVGRSGAVSGTNVGFTTGIKLGGAGGGFSVGGSHFVTGMEIMDYDTRGLYLSGKYTGSTPTAAIEVATGAGDFVLHGLKITTGAGTPEAVVTAPIGSLFLRNDGGASTTLYVKTSGSGNTGWTAK